MKKEDALKIAKEIDGDTYVDCQELVIDIYNHVEDFVFSDLAKENKALKQQLKNEEENNIDSETAKGIIIRNQQDEIKKHKFHIEYLEIEIGKKYALGFIAGIVLSIGIIQVMRIF